MVEKGKSYLKIFWQFIRPYKKELRFVYFLHFLNALLNLFPAFSIRFYIDLVLLNKPVNILFWKIPAFTGSLTLHDKIMTSLVFLGGMVLLIIFANFIGVVMWRLGTKNVEMVLRDIKIKIHNHINKLSLGYFHDERIGTIMTKAVGDVTNVNQLLKNSFFLTYQIVQLVVTPFLMLSLSPILFLIVLIPAPLIIYAFYNIRHRLKPMYKEQRENESRINSQIQEVVSGIKEVKAFNMEKRTEDSYKKITWRFYDTQNRIMKVFSFNHQLQYGAKDLGMLLVAILGGVLFFNGFESISVGVITSFIALSSYIYQPISSFLGFYDVIQRGMVSLERIIDFLSIEEDVKDKSGACDLKKDGLKGAVRYDDVSFSYDKGNSILENISFTARPGEKIAIVGSSGSGKTTLLSLLLRFYDCDSGKISIDGVDIREYTQASLRRNIGIVFQETFLFYGSIKDNLLYVNPNKSEKDLEAACRAADIYEDIIKMPDGFDTRVGERGVRLSGGQKQRISIARIFLKDPAIVILDEATSAVDSVTEAMIQKSIDRMLVGRTSFIIAHRLSTIKNCDKIIVFDDKKITEMGNHEQLLEKKGLYANLHKKSQF